MAVGRGGPKSSEYAKADEIERSLAAKSGRN